MSISMHEPINAQNPLWSAMSAFMIGLIFGVGLIIAGMTTPQKVMDFLDLAGNWDPSLAFVMIGAIGISTVGFYFIKKRHQAILGGSIHLPTAHAITPRLVWGSVAFGVGWGLAGYCPAPALVNFGVMIRAMLTGQPYILDTVYFLVSMCIGFMIFNWREGFYRQK